MEASTAIEGRGSAIKRLEVTGLTDWRALGAEGERCRSKVGRSWDGGRKEDGVFDTVISE